MRLPARRIPTHRLSDPVAKDRPPPTGSGLALVALPSGADHSSSACSPLQTSRVARHVGGETPFNPHPPSRPALTVLSRQPYAAGGLGPASRGGTFRGQPRLAGSQWRRCHSSGTTTLTSISGSGSRPLSDRTTSLPVRTVPGRMPVEEALTVTAVDVPVVRVPVAGAAESHV